MRHTVISLSKNQNYTDISQERKIMGSVSLGIAGIATVFAMATNQYMMQAKAPEIAKEVVISDPYSACLLREAETVRHSAIPEVEKRNAEWERRAWNCYYNYGPKA